MNELATRALRRLALQKTAQAPDAEGRGYDRDPEQLANFRRFSEQMRTELKGKDVPGLVHVDNQNYYDTAAAGAAAYGGPERYQAERLKALAYRRQQGMGPYRDWRIPIEPAAGPMAYRVRGGQRKYISAPMVSGPAAAKNTSGMNLTETDAQARYSGYANAADLARDAQNYTVGWTAASPESVASTLEHEGVHGKELGDLKAADRVSTTLAEHADKYPGSVYYQAPFEQGPPLEAMQRWFYGRYGRRIEGEQDWQEALRDLKLSDFEVPSSAYPREVWRLRNYLLNVHPAERQQMMEDMRKRIPGYAARPVATVSKYASVAGRSNPMDAWMNGWWLGYLAKAAAVPVRAGVDEPAPLLPNADEPQGPAAAAMAATEARTAKRLRKAPGMPPDQWGAGYQGASTTTGGNAGSGSTGAGGTTR